MSAFFVTATGTGVGKTFTTCALVHQLRAAGRPVRALKPVLSGFDDATAAESDAGQLLEALGEPITRTTLDRLSPHRFAAPLSPDMAARREGRTIDFDALVAWTRREIDSHHGTTLVEGVGGALVPLDDSHTVLDWIAAVGAPAIVVAGTYLGTISHTLTTLIALESRQIPIRAVVLSESPEQPVAPAETRATLARFTRVPIVVSPRAAGWRSAADLASILG